MDKQTPRSDYDSVFSVDISHVRSMAAHPLPYAQPGAPQLFTSIFHEPWWLNAATGGNWEEAVVKLGGVTAARLPFTVRRSCGITFIGMPPLTRTLGPQLPQNPVAGLENLDDRKLIRLLLKQLPPHEHFRQVFDPSIQHALPFYEMGYKSALTYTVRIPREWSMALRWQNVRRSLRNEIRRAEEALQIVPIEIDEFCGFYNKCTQINNGLWWSKRFQREGDAQKIRLYEAASARNAACLVGARDKHGRLQAAIMPVWGHGVMYYFLTARTPDPNVHGAVKLLVWNAISMAHERELDFDFDGFVRPSATRFQLGFGGNILNRINVMKSSLLLDMAQAVKSRSRFGI